MQTTFTSIALMGRQHTKGVVKTLLAVIKYLRKRKVKIVIEEDTARLLPSYDLPIIAREKLKDNCDLIVVVGGDGSMLAAAHTAVDQDLPVVGINRGTLGFLTDIRPDAINDLGKILEGEYKEEHRFLLDSTIQTAKNKIVHCSALNDVVLLPSENNRMIEFCVHINSQLVCTHRADGMIIATPTGSTAHALSGGGPILHPAIDAMVLLPMFPHTLSSRPVVVDGESNIDITMAEDCHACPNISCDGQALIPMASGTKVNIKKHSQKLRLIHLLDYNYFETLRVKLHWES